MTANNLWFTQSIQDLLDTVESLLDRQEKLEAVAQCATYHIHEEEDDGACSICDSLDALRETKEKL